MINKISFEKYKSFNSLEGMTIKPITILCGTNSCGKSSILQSILMYKQTFESQNPNQIVLLNGRFTHLGTFESIIYGKNPEGNLSIEFTFKVKKEDFQGKDNAVPLTYHLREFISRERFHEKNAEYFITIKITLSTISEKIKKYMQSVRVEKWEFILRTTTENQKEYPDVKIELTHQKNNNYKVKWENLIVRFIDDEGENATGEGIVNVGFSNLMPTFWRINHEENKSRITSNVVFASTRIAILMKSLFSLYTYIGPLREEPSRRYIYENEVLEIGTKGENAAFIYLTEQENPIKNHYFFNNNTFISEKEIKLSDAIERWMSLFGIKEFKPEQQNELIYLNMNSSLFDKTRVNIAEVGFGVSQLFPIVLEGLRMPVMSTLLLEQPEIHLHPKLQMQMADFFIALALSNKKVIVETHSDHLINRLIRRIVEDESGTLLNLISIYFVTPSEHGSCYEEVKVDEYNGIVNWPVDFFDQTATEQEGIILAGIEKRRKRREQKK
ncbi:DUF3696 domain-containing protein [Heliobacterium mobile]|uniref:DUF3696 domain-containing protein n=1 Tax=Heliobacterium mobile TaxID=28064 RepID=UPI0012D73E03|nr:AAA family ATPase [Heliobacterium mobile]